MGNHQKSTEDLEFDAKLLQLEKNYYTLQTEEKARKSPDILKSIGKIPPSLQQLPDIITPLEKVKMELRHAQFQIQK